MTLAHEAATPKVAAGSSFYTAMRILPQQQREAVLAIYAFCRAVDDIADDWRAPCAARLSALHEWRSRIDDIYATGGARGLAWLAAPIQRHRLGRSNFHDVIDGMVMDATKDIRAPAMKVLDLYCDRVASAVGRLTSPIFGLPYETGLDLAHHLGRALQLTNILRDIDEDARMGRIYLPVETLAEAGFYGEINTAGIAGLDLTLACEPVVQKARRHFMNAHEIMRRRPRRETRAPLLMAKVYEQKLEMMMDRGFAPPRLPVKTSKIQALLALLGSHLG